MRLALMLAAAAALGACEGRDPVAENADVSALPVANSSSPSPSGGAPETGAPAGNAVTTASASGVPAALQGRWGLTPRDCMSALDKAVGLLIINSDELRFYESRALPAGNVQTSPDSISGDFAFTGEGQSWTNHQTLELQDGQLVRTVRDPLATFRYVRCE